MTDAHFAQNRLNWDDRAEIHIRDEAGGYPNLANSKEVAQV